MKKMRMKSEEKERKNEQNLSRMSINDKKNGNVKYFLNTVYVGT